MTILFMAVPLMHGPGVILSFLESPWLGNFEKLVTHCVPYFSVM